MDLRQLHGRQDRIRVLSPSTRTVCRCLGSGNMDVKEGIGLPSHIYRFQRPSQHASSHLSTLLSPTT